ncbi:hypothetical protein [Glycomyces tritici]|uniref:Uncharacterized protein n=1 Tax=Glycomyces tritici TaxID=2665176 RepID=A0ABT7YVL8_9ACTN|nr:hypothetical protein [Glycomyces tritici]MDN3242676.1 hypothetical protein [Glycomyces tritici]
MHACIASTSAAGPSNSATRASAASRSSSNWVIRSSRSESRASASSRSPLDFSHNAIETAAAANPTTMPMARSSTAGDLRGAAGGGCRNVCVPYPGCDGRGCGGGAVCAGIGACGAYPESYGCGCKGE